MDPAAAVRQRAVALVIRTPNQAHGDQTVEGVDPRWTVGELKLHLSSVYPSRPAVSEQRLIYAGKLLPDHLLIKDLFRQTDCVPTLHLVCAARTTAPYHPGAIPKVRQALQGQPSSGSSSATTPAARSSMSGPDPDPRLGSASASPTQDAPPMAQAPDSSPSVSPSIPELRHRIPTPASGSPSWPSTPAPGGGEMASPTFPTYSLYSPQQLLWLQHVYARQYYMQYHAALAAASSTTPTSTATIGPHPPVPAHQAPVPAPGLPNPNPIDNLPANQNPVGQDAPFIDAGAANQNMRMNAQGGAVMEDEEEADRDWLDWTYSAARLGVLLMIVYFNSSLSRFLLVMSTLLFMYLHTAGWFPFRRRAANAQQPPPPQQQQQPPPPPPPEALHNQQNQDRNPNPAEVPAEGEREEAAGEGPGAPGPSRAVLVPPHRVSAVWTAWLFFKTFFSSLIPDAPQGLAN